VCARADDAATLKWLQALDDRAARLASSAERALLAHLEGGCQVPLGALARLEGATLTLSATVCSLDGRRALSARGSAGATEEEARELGGRLAGELLAQGAAALIASERQARAVEEP